MHDMVSQIMQWLYHGSWYAGVGMGPMLVGSHDDVIKRKYFPRYRLTSLLWGESTGHLWGESTPHKGQWQRALMFSLPEQTVEQTIKTPVIWDVTMIIISLVRTQLSHVAACCTGWASTLSVFWDGGWDTTLESEMKHHSNKIIHCLLRSTAQSMSCEN